MGGKPLNLAPAPVNMNNYMNNYGGCFDGDGTVELQSGQIKKVRDIVRGD
jgi:hypothetical protein